MTRSAFLFGLAVASLIGCTHARVNTGGIQAVAPGVATVWASWVKPKATKYDFHLNITNQNAKDIIIMLGEMHCYRGKVQGTLKHTFFNTGERTIDLNPGETKTFNAVCNLETENLTGDYRLEIKNVYANPSGDGKTKGSVLARDLTLNIPVSTMED